MTTKLNDIIKDIENTRSSSEPVTSGWSKACSNIGLAQNDPMITFGMMMSSHPDLVGSSNSYHNQVHAADAVISASHLAKAEFSGDALKQNGSVLLFSMLCHDIAHSGGSNQHAYELEQKAVVSMKDYVNDNPHMKNFWDANLSKKFGDWDTFSSKVEQIILGTDFQHGPKQNLQDYNDLGTDMAKLKLLANEADILPSCTSKLGPDLGKALAEEAKNPGVGSWKGREFFLGNLAKFGSQAAKEIGIIDHIQSQLGVIKKHGAESLDKASEHNFAMVAEKVHQESMPLGVTDQLKTDMVNRLKDVFDPRRLSTGIKNSIR